MIERPTLTIAYKLGSGSEADDWELCLSMRSWRDNFTDADTNFVIIGHRPNWLADHPLVTHIPHPDPYKHNKDANLIQKLIRLSITPEVSDPFIFCSDDQFLLRHTTFAEIQTPRHLGDLAAEKWVKKPETTSENTWQNRLYRTYKELKKRNLPTLNFEGHIPYVIHKKDVARLLEFNFGEGNGLCIHTLLFNAAGISGEPISSARIRASLHGANLSESIIDDKLFKKGNLFANIGPDSLRCRHLVQSLQALFPNPAPWEAYSPTSPLNLPKFFPEANPVTWPTGESARPVPLGLPLSIPEEACFTFSQAIKFFAYSNSIKFFVPKGTTFTVSAE